MFFLAAGAFFGFFCFVFAALGMLSCWGASVIGDDFFTDESICSGLEVFNSSFSADLYFSGLPILLPLSLLGDIFFSRITGAGVSNIPGIGIECL